MLFCKKKKGFSGILATIYPIDKSKEIQLMMRLIDGEAYVRRDV